MPPKKSASATSTPVKSSTTTTASTPAPRSSKSASSTNAAPTSLQDAQQIALNLWDNYVSKTPQRVKLLDAFLAFLIVVAVLQFGYCIIGGNYPFNAFLAGFSATVGQFVLTASLRMQTNPENKDEFQGLSHERAFADFVFGSMILHFFCVNFIN